MALLSEKVTNWVFFYGK